MSTTPVVDINIQAKFTQASAERITQNMGTLATQTDTLELWTDTNQKLAYAWTSDPIGVKGSDTYTDGGGTPRDAIYAQIMAETSPTQLHKDIVADITQ